MGMGLGFGCGDGTAGVGLVGVGVEGLAISVNRALGVPGAAGTVIVGIIRADKRMAIVAGIDLGGTAVNFTLLDSAGGQFLLDGFVAAVPDVDQAIRNPYDFLSLILPFDQRDQVEIAVRRQRPAGTGAH